MQFEYFRCAFYRNLTSFFKPIFSQVSPCASTQVLQAFTWICAILRGFSWPYFFVHLTAILIYSSRLLYSSFRFGRTEIQRGLYNMALQRAEVSLASHPQECSTFISFTQVSFPGTYHRCTTSTTYYSYSRTHISLSFWT